MTVFGKGVMTALEAKMIRAVAWAAVLALTKKDFDDFAKRVNRKPIRIVFLRFFGAHTQCAQSIGSSSGSSGG